MKELVLAFSRFGWLGFGGPIASIAMMEEELQRRRGWVTERQFAEIYAICKMLPGPVATQVAISLGMERAGRLGGLVAGLVYSYPKFLIILLFSVIYFRHRIGLEHQDLFAALQTAALVVILTSTMHLARPMGRDLKAVALALLSAAVVWRYPLWEPLVILAAGLAGAFAAIRHGRGSAPTPTFAVTPMPSPGIALGVVAAGAATQPALLELFWICFKAGAFTFGTGLAIIPLLEADTVQLRSWLTHAEFMDGLTIGQVAPGPVVLTVTFIGYKVAGVLGALVATLGVLVPPFINVLYIVPRVWKRFSGTSAASGFTTWALPAIVGGIVATTVRLGIATIDSPFLAGLFVAVLAVSLKWKVPAWALIPVSGLAGDLFQRIF